MNDKFYGKFLQHWPLLGQIGKSLFAEDLYFIGVTCTAVFVLLNNRRIVFPFHKDLAPITMHGRD